LLGFGLKFEEATERLQQGQVRHQLLESYGDTKKKNKRAESDGERT